MGYLLQGEMPFIKDPRGMSAVGLVLGVAAFFVARRPSREPHDAASTAEEVLGVIAFGVGVIALILAEAAVAETLLAIFMATIAVVWAVQMLHHAGLRDLCLSHARARRSRLEVATTRTRRSCPALDEGADQQWAR